MLIELQLSRGRGGNWFQDQQQKYQNLVDSPCPQLHMPKFNQPQIM